MMRSSAALFLVSLDLLLGAAAVAAAATIRDLEVKDVVKCRGGTGGGSSTAPTTIWSPSVVVTRRNVTLANADAQWHVQPGSMDLVKADAVLSRSEDGGASFGPNQDLGAGGAQLLYSLQTDTVHAFGLAVPNVTSESALTWSRSEDDGKTWTKPVVAWSAAPVGEGGLGHGIELQHGPHRGRFVVPFAQDSQSRDKYAGHALALFSDTGGANWTAGALLPDYSGEAALTELANGSVLISFRMEGERMPRNPHVRGFARSDDGGATWAQSWFLDEVQPQVVDAPSMQGIDRSTKTGAVYWGHPGNIGGDRSNYTIHRSTDEGYTWENLGSIFPGGAGYSDVHVLPHDGPGDRLGVAFQRTIDNDEEGGGYNMAFATMVVE